MACNWVNCCWLEWGQPTNKFLGGIGGIPTTLESGVEAAIGGLTGQELSGDLLTATILSYLGLNAVQDQVQAKSGNVVAYQQPSYGKFSTRLTTNYWFGLPRSVGLDGLVMDVDRLATSLSAKDGSDADRLNFMAASGNRASAMEHLIPEHDCRMQEVERRRSQSRNV